MEGMSNPHFKRFFRDKAGGNTDHLGMDFQAAGIISEIFPDNNPDKYASVYYVHPYTGEVEYRWRSKGEIEIFEYTDNDVQWYVWDDCRETLLKLQTEQQNQKDPD